MRKGRFELADGGTIFLDEIGDLSPATQVKLLRVLQEREYMRVGGTRVIKTHARIIAATARNLPDEVEAKRFRADLFYRLNVVPIHLPPLRERREDIPLLADCFLRFFKQSMVASTRQFAPETMERLVHYDWPGNIRELRNLVERMLVLYGQHESIGVADLPEPFHNATPPAPAPAATLDGSLTDTVDAFERQLIVNALREAKGIQTLAAQRLGTTRRILKYRMDKLNIQENEIND